MARLVPIKGVPNSSFHEFWGQAMVVAVDLNDDEKVYGRSAKMRRDALPGLLSAGRFGRIKIGDDDYLHETSHWVFFKRSRTLAIEYNQHAPSYRYLQKYLDDMARALHVPIDDLQVKILLEEDTVQRLMQEGPATVIEVAAHSDEAKLLPRTNSLSRALRGVVEGNRRDQFKATVMWSRERPKKDGVRGLRDSYKEQALELLQSSRDLLETLRVTVEPSLGAKPKKIDLLRDRFVAKIEVEMTPERSVDSDDTYAKIVDHYNNSRLGVIPRA
nr:hypothetical protein [Deinococcus sp. NW-56]